jgi:hypothetical protein
MPRASGDDSSAATLRYRRSERTALYIETQEGDVVRLKIKVRDAVDATASTATDGDTQLAELSVSARSSVRISFHVEGDLNADELAAIRSVVEQTGTLAEDFFAGDLPAAFAAAQALDIDGSELAKVGLRLSVREHLTYSGPALPRPAPTPTPAEPPVATLPAPAETVEPTPEVAAAPAEEVSPEVTDPAPALPTAETGAETPPTSAQTPAPTVAPVSVAGQALAVIADFVQQLLDTLGAPPEPEDDAGTTPSLQLSLKLRIFQATVFNLAVTQLPGTTADDDASATAMPLVADTLEALAAAQEPPLDVRA